MLLLIEPIAKPRMTRSDKWRKRACVLKYRTFADEVRRRARGLNIGLESVELVFTVAMPASWCRRKKAEFCGMPHQSKPDLDNMVKAFFDALLEDDSGVWRIAARKVWGEAGSIEIKGI